MDSDEPLTPAVPRWQFTFQEAQVARPRFLSQGSAAPARWTILPVLQVGDGWKDPKAEGYQFVEAGSVFPPKTRKRKRKRTPLANGFVSVFCVGVCVCVLSLAKSLSFGRSYIIYCFYKPQEKIIFIPTYPSLVFPCDTPKTGLTTQ